MKVKITAPYIQCVVAEYFSITVELLLSARRTRAYSYPRMLAMFLCRDILGMTYMSIAEAFKRDHSTVIHAVEWATNKADMQVHIEELRRRIEGAK